MNIPLIFLSLLLQVEDAMLMFDKTTNRHRGKMPFLPYTVLDVLSVSVLTLHACLWVCYYECPLVNPNADYLFSLTVFHAGTGNPSAVCFNIALCLQGRFILALKVKANAVQ